MENQPTNPISPKPPIMVPLIIIVVIITAVIVGGGVYLWQSSFAKTLLDKAKNNEQALTQQLNSLKTALTNLGEEKIQDAKSAIKGDEWQKINHGFYSFEIPASWKIDFTGLADNFGMSSWGIPVFKDKDNKIIAEFRCPLWETGYEGAEITSTTSRIITLENSRTYYQPSISTSLLSSKTHKVKYIMGNFSDQAFYLIMFGPSTEEQEFYEDMPNTCEIVSLNKIANNNEWDSTFSHIYNSVTAYPLLPLN